MRVVKGNVEPFEGAGTDIAGVFSFRTDSPGILEQLCYWIVDLNPTERECLAPNEIGSFWPPEALTREAPKIRR